MCKYKFVITSERGSVHTSNDLYLLIPAYNYCFFKKYMNTHGLELLYDKEINGLK